MSDSTQETPWPQDCVLCWAISPRERYGPSRPLSLPHNQTPELNNSPIAKGAWSTTTGRKAGRELEATGLADWLHTTILDCDDLSN